MVWDLSVIGVQTAVGFLVDPRSTGGTNGINAQRGTGFDNLVVNANVQTTATTTPEPSLGLFSLLGFLGLGLFKKTKKKTTN